MSEMSLIAVSIKTALLELAKQADMLGKGLQNAAPGESGSANQSVNYLQAISQVLNQKAEELEKSINQ